MVEIKPDEISAILRQQLSNFNAGASLEEVGTVLQVGMVSPVYTVSIMFAPVNWWNLTTAFGRLR